MHYVIGINRKFCGDDSVTIERRYPEEGAYRRICYLAPDNDDGSIDIFAHQLITTLEEVRYPIQEGTFPAIQMLLDLDEKDFSASEVQYDKSFIEEGCDTYVIPADF